MHIGAALVLACAVRFMVSSTLIVNGSVAAWAADLSPELKTGAGT